MHIQITLKFDLTPASWIYERMLLRLIWVCLCVTREVGRAKDRPPENNVQVLDFTLARPRSAPPGGPRGPGTETLRPLSPYSVMKL